MFVQQTWVSNSSISDFLKCPRAYYLKNVYKNQNGKKISLINPSLTLGSVVHEVIESLSKLPCEERFSIPLAEHYDREWKKYSGELGGFISTEQEEEFKQRGLLMLQRVSEHPGPLLNKALKLDSHDHLPPRFLLSEKENILLCGKIDWLEYMPEDNSVHIIDFKTGKHDEDENSLQLPIYCLLVTNLQKRPVNKISYWYIDREDKPREMPLPEIKQAYEKVLDLALNIKEIRNKREYTCRRHGCYACKPLEEIILGNCKYIGTRDYQDCYIANSQITQKYIYKL